MIIINRVIGVVLIALTPVVLYGTYWLMSGEHYSIHIALLYSIIGCTLGVGMILLGMFFMITKENLFKQLINKMRG